jgi:hypothetical protein
MGSDVLGFDLSQSGGASDDIRLIMSEQLNELRMLRAESQKKNDQESIAIQKTNPFSMNPFYTENHARNIDNTINSINALDAPRNEFFNGPLRKLSNFVDSEGIGDMKKGIINGRGYSEADLRLASVRNEANRVDKMSGFIGGASNMLGEGIGGAAMAAGFSMGPLSLPVIGVGIAAGAGAEYLANRGINEAKGYFDYKERFTRDSVRFIGPGEGSDPLVSGFTDREIKKASKFMMGLNSKFDLKDGEISELFDSAMQNNLLTGANDLESFEKTMTDITSLTKKYAKVMGKSLTDISSMMGELKSAGISQTGMDAVFGTLNQNSSLLNMTPEQYIASISGRTEGMAYGTGANASAISSSLLSQDALAGSMMDAMKDLRSLDSTNTMANYISNIGVSGVSNALSGINGRYSNIVNSTLMGAAYDAASGRVSSEKMTSLLEKFKKGEITMEELQKMTSQNVTSDNYNSFMNASQDYTVENQNQTTEASVAVALNGIGMTVGELLGLKDHDAQISKLQNTGMSRDQATTALGVLAISDGNITAVGDSLARSGRIKDRFGAFSEGKTLDRYRTMFDKDVELAAFGDVRMLGTLDFSKDPSSKDEANQMLKMAYASATTGLGSTEADVKARRKLDFLLTTKKTSVFGWDNDVDQTAEAIAKEMMKGSDTGSAFSKSLSAAADSYGLDEISKTIKSSSSSKDITQIVAALKEVFQKDADAALSDVGKNSNDKLLTNIQKNTDAQFEMIESVELSIEGVTRLMTEFSARQKSRRW